MKNFTKLLLTLLLLRGIPVFAQIPVLPKPNSVKYTEGKFNYAGGLDIKIIRGDEPTKLIFAQLSEFIKSKKISVIPFSATTINLNLLQAGSSAIGSEGYSLIITPNSVTISSTGNAGLFYGMQSLFQLLSADTTRSLACMQINDQPAFNYRGFQLDVSRHFFSPDVIKQYLDVMAKLKLNQFHWHLTDDQGWRIEIKKYPKLMQTGACRKEKDGTDYCGYYTQEDIRQIVQYAKDRYINIIPEIDIPGHSSAAIASYPELGCLNRSITVPNTFGIKEDVLCPTDSTLQFLRNVFDEVCGLFPGKYIHIGGDETPVKQWVESEAAKTFSADKHIEPKEIRAYFISQMEQWLAAKGRKCIGWGDIADGKLSQGMTVMSWRGNSAGVKAAAQGNDVIMAPRQYCYFDYPQDWEDEKQAFYMMYLPIDKVYGFDPASGIKSDQARKHVLGGQACAWTEYIPDAAQLQYQVFPRIVAMAECLWTDRKEKKFSEFEKRLKAQKNYFVKEKDEAPVDLIHFRPKTK